MGNILPGMLSDQEFASLKEMYLRTHEQIDEAKVREQLADFSADIEECLANLDQEHAHACIIYLQGYNLLALLLGVPQWETPREVLKQIPEFAEQIKHVAIVYIGDEVVLRTIDHVLSSLGKSGYRTYYSTKLLLDAILDNDVKGIVGIRLEKFGSIQQSIRHDLKNRDGWDYEKAEQANLPPCFDVQVTPKGLTDILTAFAELEKDRQTTTDAQSQEDRPIDLKKEIINPNSDLKKSMLVPDAEVTVSIFDDRREEIQGLVQILDIWPHVTVAVQITQSQDDLTTAEYRVLANANILLIDEMMNELTGTQFYQHLLSRYGGQTDVLNEKHTVASITGGQKPPWAKHHFQQKSRVAKSRQAALAFIHFMNELIKTRNK